MKLHVKTGLTISIIFSIVMVVQFAASAYVPSFPSMAEYFNVPSGPIQLTLVLFLLGLSLAQLLFGTLSDLIGRKPALLIGFLIFMVSSIVCIFSHNISLLIAGRFFEGFGIGSGLVIARAVGRDLFSGKKFAQFASYLIAAIVLTRLLSPIIGGYFQHYLNWRYTFAFALLLTITITFFIITLLPETLPIQKQKRNQIKTILNSFKILLKSKRFMINVLCASFSASTTVIYITLTPFLYHRILGITPVVVGWLIALTAIGIMVGNLLNAQLVKKFKMKQLMIVGTALMLISSLIMLILGLLHFLNLYVIIIPMLIIVMGIGFISPNAAAFAFEPFPKIAGSAAAIFGCIQMFTYAVVTYFATLFREQNQIVLAVLLLVPAIIIAGLLSIKIQNQE